MSTKQKLSDFATFLIPVLLIGLWIVGALHGKKKHKVDPFSSNFFVCWYYGIETMWHKTDFKELNDDIKIITMYLVENSSEMGAKEMIDHNESKKDIKDFLKLLDKTEITYIKDGVNSFLEFTSSLSEDMVNGIVEYKKTNMINFQVSEKTKTKLKNCSKYGLETEMKDYQNGLQSLQNNFKEKAEKNAQEFNKQLFDESTLRENTTKKSKELKAAAKDLFNNL